MTKDTTALIEIEPVTHIKQRKLKINKKSPGITSSYTVMQQFQFLQPLTIKVMGESCQPSHSFPALGSCRSDPSITSDPQLLHTPPTPLPPSPIISQTSTLSNIIISSALQLTFGSNISWGVCVFEGWLAAGSPPVSVSIWVFSRRDSEVNVVWISPDSNLLHYTGRITWQCHEVRHQVTRLWRCYITRQHGHYCTVGE